MINLEEAAAILCLTTSALDLLSAANAISDEEAEHREKRCCVKKWRETSAESGNIQFLLNEYKLAFDGDRFKSYLRMDEGCFHKLLSLVKDDISKKDTNMWPCVPVEEKLAVALRYLATGENFKELDENTKFSQDFISRAVIEVCESIYRNGRRLFLKFPDTKSEWLQITKEFKSRWQFPHCLGALDGKHIAFKPRKRNAEIFHNYKGFKSIVLLAVADAFAKFTFIDVGCNGRISDGGVLNRSKFMEILQNPDQYLPPSGKIGENIIVPHVFIGDNAFPLLNNLITPYPFTTKDPEKIKYNYRLSRARQNIERAFGILSNRFQILQKQILLDEVKATKIVQACCVLHNFLIISSNCYIENNTRFEENTPTSFDESNGTEQTISEATVSTGSNVEVRALFKEYFSKDEEI